jgi:hypothetical protein
MMKVSGNGRVEAGNLGTQIGASCRHRIEEFWRLGASVAFWRMTSSGLKGEHMATRHLAIDASISPFNVRRTFKITGADKTLLKGCAHLMQLIRYGTVGRRRDRQ